MNTRANRKVQGDARNIEGSHAVVLGGSLAGFLAARCCCESLGKGFFSHGRVMRDRKAEARLNTRSNHVTEGKYATEERYERSSYEVGVG